MVLLNRELKQAGNPIGKRNIKWQGLKMSEHMKFLSEWYAENKQEKRPELDNEAKHLIQKELTSALIRKCQVRMQLWKNHDLHYHVGRIVEMDPETRTIVFDEPFGMKRLPIDEIVKIMPVD
ncbi:YolD-like family protein [Planococcus shenhongbingii]|uniref:YolD-like family protein n=1 Tax=Planococcus shenhongbingii TaxID=3058398 RepID=A0ABT8N8C8_9BACL|nr:YolD-like family protein [Planococcus sp. N017]MDN7244139.1 YolD-like family protein [Planococcus sp. N017]